MTTSTPPIKLSCIIDDDEVYIRLIKKIIDIKKLSENLLIFNNGKEALDYFTAIIQNVSKNAFPEIILLDLNMPVMDGWDFLKKFTQIKPPNNGFKTTLYIVSSSIDPYEIERAKSFNYVKDYLVKPVSMDEFEAIFKSKTA
ncbi:response regulator [Ulvibacter antarcticus]|uniref:Response regulator receiver domain-containing protein n=1 Tax=Ulvibacter antarcticus TaxID=442714 RepID=A0A3L9YZ57_9FLAO|nr:response regulator [Ulvibacter antarcticus]RMA65863.1 response regulator receiver domain-containing protein [Ulvibacter antarcticus]